MLRCQNWFAALEDLMLIWILIVLGKLSEKVYEFQSMRVGSYELNHKPCFDKNAKNY
jgi:hypothetical protein